MAPSIPAFPYEFPLPRHCCKAARGSDGELLSRSSGKALSSPAHGSGASSTVFSKRPSGLRSTGDRHYSPLCTQPNHGRRNADERTEEESALSQDSSSPNSRRARRMPNSRALWGPDTAPRRPKRLIALRQSQPRAVVPGRLGSIL